MSRKAQSDDGAIALEAALIFPLLAVLVFGIIEWGLAMRDHVEMTSVTRSGARVGAALAPNYNPYVETVAANRLTAEVAYAVEQAALGLPKDSIDFLYVYKANNSGFPGNATSITGLAAGCAAAPGTCDTYKWTDGVGFANEDPATGLPLTTTPWLGNTVDACLDESDRMGVALVSTRKMITGLFGTQKTMRTHTVMQFEPRNPGRCKPPTP